MKVKSRKKPRTKEMKTISKLMLVGIMFVVSLFALYLSTEQILYLSMEQTPLSLESNNLLLSISESLISSISSISSISPLSSSTSNMSPGSSPSLHPSISSNSSNLSNPSISESLITAAVVYDSGGDSGIGILGVDGNSTSCGTLNGNVVLTANVANDSNCFEINASNIMIDCAGFTITYGNVNTGKAITSTGYNNLTVKNCIIKHGSTSGTGDSGIDFNHGNGGNFTNNSIYANGTSSANAIYLLNATQTVINNNSLYTTGIGKGNEGIELDGNSTGVNVTNSFISTNGTSDNHGILLSGDSHHNRFINNQITTNGTDSGFNSGIHLLTNSSFNHFENIHILTQGQKNSSAINIQGKARENIFVNVNMTVTDVDTQEMVDGTGDSNINYLIYNNSFGEIRWTNTTSFGFLEALGTNISNSDGLGLGRNIFIGNNTAALNISAMVIDSYGAININSSANITFYGINLTSVGSIFQVANYTEDRQDILGHGADCLGGKCASLSFTGRTFVFNVTGFSSYTAQEDTTSPAISFIKVTTNSSNRSQSFLEANISFSDINLDRGNITLWNSSRMKINSTNSSTSPLFINFTSLADGTYYLNATANDTGGNTNQTETRTIVLDTTSPLVSFVAPSTNTSNLSQTFIFANVSASDSTLGINNVTLWNSSRMKINSTDSGTSSSPFTNFTGLAEGTYYLNATANDSAGNTNQTETRTIILDTTFPSISFAAVTTNTSNLSQTFISANVSASDTNLHIIRIFLWNSSQIMINNSYNGTSPLFVNFTGLTDGTYYLNATANDSAGNMNQTEIRTIILDTTSPSISFIGVTTNTSNISQTFISANVSASDSTLAVINITLWDSSQMKLNSASSGNSTLFINFTGLTDGTYYLNASANDSNGYTNQTETRVIILDTTPPSISFTAVTTSTSNFSQTFISANVSASDQALSIINITLWNSSQMKINSTNSSTSPLFINFTGLTNGTYYLNASADDSVGNTNQTETRTIILDTTSPSISFVSVTTNTSNLSQTFISANVSASDGALGTINITLYNSLQLKLNTTSSGTSPLSSNFTGLADGTYYLNATANDSAGNTNQTETRTIILDITRPGVASPLPSANAVYNITNTIEIAANATDNIRISQVFANVTYPNGTINQLTLSNKTNFDNKYNVSFTIPELTGLYNITYIANDQSNNINSSQTSNFTVNVGCAVINSNIIMNQNVSSTDTCFTLNASNIRLDCSNYMINTTGVAINITNDNTTVINCNIQPSTIRTISDSSSGSNTLIYNNSFGQINWTLSNLTTNISLVVGSTIFIENNNVGLANNPQSLNLNGTAKIELRNRSYGLSTPILLKNGVRCDDTYACNMTYDNSTLLISADVSSFSNYTTVIGCGNWNESITLTQNITAYGTCYFAGTNDITLDCNGYSITYASEISGTGINSSHNNDNLTIKNCVFISAGVGSNNYGIYMKDGIPTFGSVVGSTIVNNTFYTDGNDSNYGIFIHTNYNHTSIINNTIYTNGTGGKNYGILVNDSAFFTNITGNTIYTNGTNNNYGIYLSSQADSGNIRNNVIRADGYGNNYGIYILSASENKIESNDILSSGNDSGNDGVRIDGTSHSNIFLNNNITGDTIYYNIYDGNGSTSNTLIYNNSFGQINWTLTNLTTNITLVLNSTIFIQNNTIGLTDDIQAFNLDGQAQIEIRNLSYDGTPHLLKDGTRCDNSNACNITYNSTAGVLYANVSSFSNYTTTAETDPSSIFSLTPTANSVYNITNIIEVAANVTDASPVSKVFANITYPNGTITQLTLSNKTNFDNKYNGSFTAPVLIGNYNITYIANDTRNNRNETERSNFTINDIVNPSVFNLTPNNNEYNISNTIDISANVTDDIAVSKVFANITYPNGTITQLTLSNKTNFDNKYNASFTIPSSTGLYNLTYIANDSSNNLNSSTTSNFTVNDVFTPNVTIVIPSANSVYNITNTVEIAANVTDQIAVSRVFANVTYPNGTITQLTLSNKTNFDNKYNVSFTIPSSTGLYNLTYIANDSSNNINSSMISNFTVNDVFTPNVTTFIPSANSVYNITNTIEIAANVTDQIAVSRVFANLTYPNGTITQLTLSNASTHNDKFNTSFTAPQLTGTYNITFIANDTSNNRNTTENSNFTIGIGCGTITQNLTLNRNISGTDCLSITASDVVLNCAGYSITHSGYGIQAGNNTIIKGCQITQNDASSSSYGIKLGINVTIINTNITSNGSEAIITTSTGSSSLIYNNSFGQINWTLSNLTTNISLQIGSTIFIENNKVGLTDNAQALNLDGSAQIELRNLTYTTPQLLKDGTRCDNSNACNMTYDSTNKIVYANISSFSNYTTQETPASTDDTGAGSSGGSGSSGGAACASGYHLLEGRCVQCIVDADCPNGGECENNRCVEKMTPPEEVNQEEDDEGAEKVEDVEDVEGKVPPLSDGSELREMGAQALAGRAFFDLLLTVSKDLSTYWVAIMILIVLAIVIYFLIRMIRQGLSKRRHYYPLVPITQTGRDTHLENKLAILKTKLLIAKEKKAEELGSKEILEQKAQLLRELIRKKQQILDEENTSQEKRVLEEREQRRVNRQVRMLELDPYQKKKPVLIRERLERRMNFLQQLIEAKKRNKN